MRIAQLNISNFQIIKAVEINPKDNTIIIAGENGVGKSSIIKAIWAAVAGPKAITIEKPIREGQTSAEVVIDLEEYTVKRRWTLSGSTLRVENKDGVECKSPQELLNKFIGSLSFDPLKFASKESKDQVKELMKVSNLEDKLLSIDQKIKEVYDERTAVNRKSTICNSVINKTLPETIIEVEPTEDLIKQITEAGQINSNNAALRTDFMNAQKDLNNAIGYSDSLALEIKELEEKLKSLKSSYNNAEANVKRLKTIIENSRDKVSSLEDIDISVVNEKLKESQRISELNRQITANNKAKEDLLNFENESAKLTEQLKALSESKVELLKNVKLPYPGLTFDEEGVFYNNVPLKQCSSSEQLKVSVAMAMALNPRLKVLRIQDGNLLDDKNLEVIKSMVKEKDYQIWIEKVDSSGKIGFVISDGEIIANNEEPKQDIKQETTPLANDEDII